MAETEGASAKEARSKEEEANEAERRFGGYVARGLPVVTVAAALGTGFLFSAGPAFLVLVGGMLLGTIALLWASLRTLSGDAPLPVDLEAVAARSHRVSDASEQKRRVMRALKDLEAEHAIGKIDDADYAELAARYRDEAKQLMRDMDDQIDPLRARAEEIAQAHLKKKKLKLAPPKPAPAPEAAPDDDDDDEEDETDAPPPAKPKAERLACPKCETSNEPDAAFCKKCGTPLGEAREPEEKVDDATA